SHPALVCPGAVDGRKRQAHSLALGRCGLRHVGMPHLSASLRASRTRVRRGRRRAGCASHALAARTLVRCDAGPRTGRWWRRGAGIRRRPGRRDRQITVRRGAAVVAVLHLLYIHPLRSHGRRRHRDPSRPQAGGDGGRAGGSGSVARQPTSPIPIAWYPLSTYTVLPVIPLASGEQRKAAARPTSSARSLSVSGAFAETYSTIFSMMPIALAAREASGPAEMVLTRQPNIRPASNARVRVSLSSAAFADDMPPP